MLRSPLTAVVIAAEPDAADGQYTMTINKHLVVQFAETCSPADVSWGAAGTGVAKAVFTARQDGYWRAHYAGNAWYDKQTSPSDYVDVT